MQPTSTSSRLCTASFTSVVLVLATLTACGDKGADASSSVHQTRFPGQVTAGGGTSGQVMASAQSGATAAQQGGTPGIPAGSGGNIGGAIDTRAPAPGGGLGNEGIRGHSAGQGVAGTPGIPEGSGGTSSGAEMGGTSRGAAGTKTAPGQQKPGETTQGNSSPASSRPEGK